ncbi:MAG TPA: sodium-extruding oxaloacetate decarboxylase subunit alpha [Spirochaetota bacterium]|nr:sodium-extruding oxaloacetate decarboxylase subunit alpha [Spirochaetota bacterium]HOS31893.1 sodium-extruding oxaloacetate decarboxylase subunit alpha [Spirochaetota bacterium]HOS54480.1 sodium-extruding oxaloacetate decarboxylase subunit alpha [Spirochaetota bacterium]HQF76973.1 sodium-extruding oxaloacetate decarboxylase subunit alpha [Spirochaetota bacterium]HQH29871.1 sodium-extruding oxaloacetate decarboxylase subunit alpha [Spirochaetota bacterium]
MAKIKVTDLALRDAHQSLLATRMVTSDMLPIAEKLNKVGFWSMETWGGATFDSCIRFLNEDPWERIRKLKAAHPNTQMQMLLRGQNLLGYRNYADDVVDKFVERAAINGVDVFRIFDALNDPRNLDRSIKAVKKAKKHAQGTISYATTPYHTIEKYVELAEQLVKLGVDSICIKDMAGLLKPYDAFNLIKALKGKIGVPISVHSHSTTGMSVATLVKAVEAGAEMIDTAISSMGMGTSHSPTETMVEILQNTEWDTGLDVKLLVEIAGYFREIRKKYKQFESSFLGADTRILIAQVPGGMLSNLESQLKEQNASEKIDDVLKEIAVVQKDFGYPPLVTPTSQIVGTQSVFNVIFGRYNRLTAESKNLLVGNYGKTPAKPNEELVKKAMSELNIQKVTENRPADNIPNEFDKIAAELKEKMGGKEVHVDDVLTYALFPQIAVNFLNNRDKGPVVFEAPVEDAKKAASKYVLNVNGKEYNVEFKGDNSVSVDGKTYEVKFGEGVANTESRHDKKIEKGAKVIESPVAGTVLRYNYKDGDSIKEGDTLLILESMKMELEIKSTAAGKIEYLVDLGDKVSAGQPIVEVLS